MALSFYECVAQGKWERVAIVNTFLERHFSTFISSDDAFQKTGIRSFSWCSPLKTPTAGDSASPYHVPRPESRWGFYFLNITNDDNDVICLQVRRSSTETDAASQFSMNILSLTSLHDLVGNYPTVQPASLLSMAVKSGLKATSLSCGPWVPNAEVEKGAYVATALVAVVYGTKLKVVRLDVSVPMQDVATGYQRSTTANLAEFAMSAENLGNYHFRGPIQWISNVGQFSTGPRITHKCSGCIAMCLPRGGNLLWPTCDYNPLRCVRGES